MAELVGKTIRVPCIVLFPLRTSNFHSYCFEFIAGIFAECELEEDQQRWSRHNVFLLYECGAFTTFLELLNLEIE